MLEKELSEKCINLISQPDYRRSYLNDLQERYCGICGCFSNYIPEEIVVAAGLHPVRIIGRYESSGSHRNAVFNPVCSFVQDIYGAAKSGCMSSFSHMIFPNSCDSLKVLQQMWENDTLQPPAYTLLHPIKADTAAIQYFTTQIQDFKEWLIKNGGSEFSQDDLLEAISKYNQTRNLLRQLYQQRNADSQFLSGSDAFSLMTAGLIMDRDEYNQILSHLVDEGKSYTKTPKQDLKRIMVIGPLLDNIELLKTIEGFGATIVADEVTNGWRYFDLSVEPDGDLYHNLASRYLRSGPSPTLNVDPVASFHAFRDRVVRHKLDGVICINQKFCEPHVHNYLAKVEVLRQVNINCLMLEIEHGQKDISERDLLRIESFLEVENCEP